MNTIEQRLDKLEGKLARANRRNRWLLGGMVVCLAAWVVAGTCGAEAVEAQPAGTSLKVVRASEFILEDEKGKVRAVLGVTKDRTGLVLTDENGKVRVLLGAFKNGPRLDLFDENEKASASLVATKNGPILFLTDENGKERANLKVSKGGPVLALADENGKHRVALGVTKGGGGWSWPTRTARPTLSWVR